MRHNNLEMHEDDLREFLSNRITELKSNDPNKVDESAAGRFKFKASTISNIVPSGHISEHSRLE